MSLSQGEGEREFPDGRPLAEQPRWRQDFPIDIPEDDSLARREFTKFLVLTSGAFLAGQCWIGLTSLAAREQQPPEQRLAAEADLQPGQALVFRYPGEDDPCLLIRLSDGRLLGYGQQCTHLSCAVVPDLEHGQLRCPCHHGFFEVNDGRPIAGPPRRPLPRIKLEVRDGIIYATGVERRTV